MFCWMFEDQNGSEVRHYINTKHDLSLNSFNSSDIMSQSSRVPSPLHDRCPFEPWLEGQPCWLRGLQRGEAQLGETFEKLASNFINFPRKKWLLSIQIFALSISVLIMMGLPPISFKVTNIRVAKWCPRPAPIQWAQADCRAMADLCRHRWGVDVARCREGCWEIDLPICLEKIQRSKVVF